MLEVADIFRDHGAAVANPYRRRGSVPACLQRRKRLHGLVVAWEFGSTRQVFKHLSSIPAEGIPNLAASRHIRRVTHASGS